MVEVDCPAGGCGYSADSVKSVEAHISGSTAGDHAGHLGREFREDLVEQAEARTNGGGEHTLPLPSLDLTPSMWVGIIVVAFLLLVVVQSSPTGSTATEQVVEEDDQGAEPTFEEVAPDA